MGGGFPQGVIAAGGAGPPGGGGGGGAAAVAAAHAGLLAVPPVGGGGENKTNEFMLYTESDDSDDDCAELGELNQGRRAALNCDRISGTYILTIELTWLKCFQFLGRQNMWSGLPSFMCLYGS